MKRSTVDVKALVVLSALSLALIAYVIAGVAQGYALENDELILDCSDETMLPAITAPDRALAMTARIADDAARNTIDDEQDGEYSETDYIYTNGGYTEYSVSDGTYYAEYNDLYNENGPSRSMPGWYDGYLETYYNASSHYLASEWTVDDEGFYRDEAGRYVVGVDINDVNPDTGQQYQYGDVVQTGRGEGVVYDYGSGAHVHDFATTW